MKLTQSQRADLLAQFFSARATACLPVSEKMKDAKEMLQAYEDELASWPELPPPVYGPGAQQMADSFRSDVPVPLTDEQARKLRNLPATSKPFHNPENVDFTKYPIPPGYTVASEEDAKIGACPDWLLWTSNLGWMQVSTPTIFREWTYLRPLRKDEK